MKVNKYLYLLVIQQYYASSYGWEDVSEYNEKSKIRCVSASIDSSLHSEEPQVLLFLIVSKLSE